jgi:aspartate/methionine/tyrosine aminotransferase
LSSYREEFYLLDWLHANLKRAHHNLASSGVEAPNLGELGIETNPDLMTDLRNLKLEDSLAEAYGIPANEVLVCAGATLAIYLAIASFLKPGDHVLIPMPNYPPEYNVPRILGAHPHRFKMTYDQGFQLNADYFAEAITKETKLIVLTNSNNPTGLKIGKRDLEKIVQAAGTNGALVFVDETFREFAEDPAPIARSLGDHVISAGSMTKFFGLGDIRVGWLFAGKQIMERIRSLNQWVSIEVSRLSYMIGIQAVEKRKLLSERTRKTTKENLSLGKEFIHKNKEYVEWIEPNGAPFGFPRINFGLSSKELSTQLIEEFRILISPGEFFESAGHFRLCLTRSPDKTSLALGALSDALSIISSRL